MHGLVNRSIEYFLRDTYGETLWYDVARRAELDFDTFEAMLAYEPDLTNAVLHHSESLLGKPREALLEDIGHYLVSHRTYEALRRLLRFGGDTFMEFVLTLDELPDRARLAVPDLLLPEVRVLQEASDLFTIDVGPGWSGFGHVLTGIIRAMADDYGALVLIEQAPAPGGSQGRIALTVHEARFSEGRSFVLGADIR